MDSELEKLLREKVRKRFGTALASKASPEYLVKLSEAPGKASRSTRSKVGPPGQISIVETIDVFDVRPIVPTVRTENSTNARREFRRQLATEWQSAVLKRINSVSVELVDNLTGLPPQNRSTGVSWVNACIQTPASFDFLADVAQDPLVTFVDLPRMIGREIDVTGKRTKATAFRRETSLTGKGIIVALVDGEIYAAHPALQGRVRQIANFTKEDWGKPDWHATAVAGIVGSADIDSPGMAPDVMLYNYKVFPTEGRRRSAEFLGEKGIGQALVDGVDIINLSWGSKKVRKRKSREARACDVAWATGAVVVKSAGNRGSRPNQLTMPAEADGIIVVGATNRACTAIAPYSSGGAPAGVPPKPHLVAPGGTEEDGISSCDINGGFSSVAWGTSFSAPHVSGLIALLLQQKKMSPDEVRNYLLQSFCAKIPGSPTWAQGAGVIKMI